MHRYHTGHKTQANRQRRGDSPELRHLEQLAQQAGDGSEYVDDLVEGLADCRAMDGDPERRMRRVLNYAGLATEGLG